jgi:tetratricopeptide (TPR) repeat protein
MRYSMSTSDSSIAEMMASARALERADDLSEAGKLYSKIVAAAPLHVAAYNRLMIVYRKQKEYRKELQLINQAIKAYEDGLAERQQAWTKSNRKAAKLSKTLASKLGLVDKKGTPVYEQDIERWRKRKQTVTKRVGK